ncbi:hypothetical protein HHK36_030333 [Tetracentron sinense]|uniref:RING-type domain-containing protein n=1 Tax=Tetracentron sinense TaxID=13715 RepID=A0A835CYL5_TETSI|nr:hypothetical protein HHK36_030333 [Tetracentron sinense]
MAFGGFPFLKISFNLRICLIEMEERYKGASMYLLVILYSYVSLLVSMASANIVLIGNNVSLSFDDIEANFAPSVKGSGEYGILYLAEPLDACFPLTNKVDPGVNGSSTFALIVRGGCTFEDKARRAQNAGFNAAIVYDNEDDGVLVANGHHGFSSKLPTTESSRTIQLLVWIDQSQLLLSSAFKGKLLLVILIKAVAGNSAGIKIHAVFVSKSSGEILKKYAGFTNVDLWIIPSFENSAWSIMAISFISLLAMSAVLATCFFVRRHRIRRERPRASHVREFHGMSSRLVKAMPSLIFTSVLEDNSTSSTCAICLEDYSVGEKLRVLPCHHKFHAGCVDSWLTTWRTFCPVCKRDARTSTSDPPASECTPLLSSGPASVSSSYGLSSVRSSLASSSAIQIAPASSGSPSVSRAHFLSSARYVPQSIQSTNSPALSLSRSSVDLRNASSQRSYASHLISPHSLGYPSLSHFNSRYISPYIPSSSNASPSFVASSSQQPPMLHCSESTSSFSPFASAQSLPGC